MILIITNYTFRIFGLGLAMVISAIVRDHNPWGPTRHFYDQRSSSEKKSYFRTKRIPNEEGQEIITGFTTELTQYGHDHILLKDFHRAACDEVQCGEYVAPVDEGVAGWGVGCSKPEENVYDTRHNVYAVSNRECGQFRPYIHESFGKIQDSFDARRAVGFDRAEGPINCPSDAKFISNLSKFLWT